MIILQYFSNDVLNFPISIPIVSINKNILLKENAEMCSSSVLFYYNTLISVFFEFFSMKKKKIFNLAFLHIPFFSRIG